MLMQRGPKDIDWGLSELLEGAIDKVDLILVLMKFWDFEKCQRENLAWNSISSPSQVLPSTCSQNLSHCPPASGVDDSCNVTALNLWDLCGFVKPGKVQMVHYWTFWTCERSLCLWCHTGFVWLFSTVSFEMSLVPYWITTASQPPVTDTGTQPMQTATNTAAENYIK